jgi:lysophospholipase L1-like esterase
VDGLHLRPAGYQALADAFFAAIQATVPQTPLSHRAPFRHQ